MERDVFEVASLSGSVELTAEPPRFLKEISRVGVRAPVAFAGEDAADITRGRLEEWVKCFYETGAAVPVRRRGPSAGAGDVGRVEGLFVEEDKLYAVLGVDDAPAAALLREGGAADAAVGIERDVAAPGGKRYPECIRYVDLGPAAGAGCSYERYPKGDKTVGTLTANYDAERKDGILVAYKVAARAVIYKGAMVCLNSRGYAVPAADEPGLRFAGFAYERGDNAAGGDGDVSVRVWKDGSFRVAMSSPALEDLGADAYIVDDNAVALDTSHSVWAGTIVEIPADGVVRVLIRNAVR
ncbi:MAG TPA: hypothetical protein VMW93_10720 [bacterium]|nr:hypothetical protein [bacterium]